MYFFRSSQRKKPLTPSKLAPSPSMTIPLFVDREVGPRHVEPDAAAGGALQLGQLRAVVRLAPRLDRVLEDRLRGIGHDQRHVQLDDVAEAMTERAGAERVVEREQPRLRYLVGDVAHAALEALAEPVNARGFPGFFRQLDRERGAAPFDIGGLDRVGEPRPKVPVDLQPIDDHLQRRTIFQRQRVHVLERDGLAVDEQAAEALPAKRRNRLGDRIAQPREIELGCRGLVVHNALPDRRFLVVQIVHRGERRCRDHRHVEPDHDARAGRQLTEAARDHLSGLAHDLTAAASAIGPAHARVKQSQIVVDLGRRADRGSGIPDAVLLPDRDGGTDALDRVDVRLLHPFEELAGVRRQRFDVSALPFGVNRVEGQRRLARAADPGHDDQRPRRQRHVDILQIVCAGAADDDMAALELQCWTCSLRSAPWEILNCPW